MIGTILLLVAALALIITIIDEIIEYVREVKAHE